APIVPASCGSRPRFRLPGFGRPGFHPGGRRATARLRPHAAGVVARLHATCRRGHWTPLDVGPRGRPIVIGSASFGGPRRYYPRALVAAPILAADHLRPAVVVAITNLGSRGSRFRHPGG